MDFRTIVDIEKPKWQIEPAERILFVGSCFADRIGQRFAEEHFPVTVNPYGVMYNPASILHTVEKVKNDECEEGNYDVAVLTLGTNHIYIEKATGEIVDNCQKRPQSLFEERHRQSHPLSEIWIPPQSTFQVNIAFGYRRGFKRLFTPFPSFARRPVAFHSSLFTLLFPGI